VIPFLILSLLPTTLSTDFWASKTINSSGFIISDSASLIINEVNSQNLAPMFQDGTCRWGDYHLYGDVYYGAVSNPQITHKDKMVLHNGHPTIRIDGPRTQHNWAREVNEYFYSVKPGDRIVLKVWIKANPSSIGPGGIAGFDFYGAYGRISECHPRTIQSEIWRVDTNGYPISGDNMAGSAIYVPYGSDWSMSILDVIIPATYYSGNADRTSYPKPVQISSIGLWIGASWNQNESASIWFADAEFYINP
jgi:hypothetical protein